MSAGGNRANGANRIRVGEIGQVLLAASPPRASRRVAQAAVPVVRCRGVSRKDDAVAAPAGPAAKSRSWHLRSACT